MSTTRSRLVLPLLAVGLVLARLLLPASTIESVYSRGVFSLLRTVFDTLLGWVPFPLFYLFWGLIAYLLLRLILRLRLLSGRARWSEFGWSLLRFVSLLVVWFLTAWGFNYGRQPVEEVMRFTPYDMTVDELRERVYTEATELARLRRQITSDTLALTAVDFPADLESAVRPLLAAALVAEGYPAPGRPHARHLYPKGILLRLSTAGVYWPFAGEGNIDAGLHPIQQPSVMAHELAHAYGFGDEGVCSFWGWLAGLQADTPSLAYAIRLGYWRRVAGRLRSVEPDAYWDWRLAELDPGIRNDLEAIYENAARYQDFAPALRDATYGTYLQLQGIQDGLLNYGTVVRLVEGWRNLTPPNATRRAPLSPGEGTRE